MSVHAVEVFSDRGELSLRVVCNAVKGASCRMRPPEGDDRETWDDDTPGLVDDECWVTDWVGAVGFDDAMFSTRDGVWASIPIGVEYDECVNAWPIPDHPTLPEVGAGDTDERNAESE